MAVPRVFVSSTCFDLADVRAELDEFIKLVGFQPVLNERGGVYFDTNKHTHDSCVDEVENCQLFVLVIGGRFGSNFKENVGTSITNAEYDRAVRCKIPIFAFVKNDVLKDNRTYQNNKQLPGIKFSSVEDLTKVPLVFDFVEQVHSASVNNAVFGFDNAKDLVSQLRKQWAGMVYQLLSERNVANQIEKTLRQLSTLQEAQEKLEMTLASLYHTIDGAVAQKEIAKIEERLIAKQFFTEISAILELIQADASSWGNVLAGLPTMSQFESWHDFVCSIADLQQFKGSEGNAGWQCIRKKSGPSITLSVKKIDPNAHGNDDSFRKTQQSFAAVKSLDVGLLSQVARDVFANRSKGRVVKAIGSTKFN